MIEPGSSSRLRRSGDITAKLGGFEGRMKRHSRSAVCDIALVASLMLAGGLTAQAAESTLPHLVEKDGRHALIVDGAPFLMLGGQSHNSSAWPATLPNVWSAIEALHANTLETPVYWEQIEPEQGEFDFSVVDQILAGAREHKVRLVLLWFGTWKNGSSHYIPMWLKRQPELCPRIIGRDGRRVDSPSPFAPALLEADMRAFRALMHHLKEADSEHTVIMVQVENEPGAWNAIRDYSPAAQKLFTEPVPEALLKALGKDVKAGGDWTKVFGKDADEFFHTWAVARFIGQVAAAGKAEYPLPLYVNAALRDPLSQPPAGTYESGGPTDNVLDVWKAGAPAVDLLAPDIYMDDSARYLRVLDLYSRPDNALFVPETSRAATVSRYCFAALARGAIGWSPFGIDSPRPTASPTSATQSSDAALEPIAVNYRVLGPMMREIAQLAFEGRLHAAVEEKDQIQQTLALGRWQAVVTFGPPTFGYGRSPKGNPEPIGRVLIAKLGENEFLVTGYLCRVDFKIPDAASSAQRDFLRVEEGSYEAGAFRPARIWNGDETDWGLNFGSAPQVLRVQLGTY
jgi:beta-galactosidase GanA